MGRVRPIHVAVGVMLMVMVMTAVPAGCRTDRMDGAGVGGSAGGEVVGSRAVKDETAAGEIVAAREVSEADAEVGEEDRAAVRVEAFPGVVALPERHSVELRAWVCLEAGWLEQVACMPGTREHEALVVAQGKPSQIHAALVAAGLTPGAPGQWFYEEGEYSFVPPRGDEVDVLARWEDADGRMVEAPIGNWIRDHHTGGAFPREPWVFTGSVIEENTPAMGPGEHYVADVTGSIIGLVTFGDEVIGFSRVLADQASVQPPEWEVNYERIPPVGTEVTVVLRRWEAGVSGEDDGRE